MQNFHSKNYAGSWIKTDEEISSTLLGQFSCKTSVVAHFAIKHKVCFVHSKVLSPKLCWQLHVTTSMYLQM
jgi:hypothetical protein